MDDSLNIQSKSNIKAPVSWSDAGCPVCSSKDTFAFYEVKSMPAQAGILFPTLESARRAPVGDISLAFCRHCGYIGNQWHDASIQDHHTNQFSLQHSPSFRAYAEQLAQSLIDRYDLRNKVVMDIGCGDGDFLRTLCRLGNNKGIGIDPGFEWKPRYQSDDQDIQYFQDYFSEKYAHFEVDFYLCRHVLNLIADPRAFVQMVRQAVAKNPTARVYFEEPDAKYNFGAGIVWNVVYEHRTWFSSESLHNLFTMCGFTDIETSNCWNDEYVNISCKPGEPGSETQLCLPSTEMAAFLLDISDRFTEVVRYWQGVMEVLKKTGKKVAAWGAGARGITFFNTMNLIDLIPYIVDINPDRQGMFMPRNGHMVVPPEFLQEYRPDVLLITNPTYAKEIQEHVQSLGCDCEFLIL